MHSAHSIDDFIAKGRANCRSKCIRALLVGANQLFFRRPDALEQPEREVTDGQLYMADRFVKFAGGQAACSAPPSGSPQEIAATMGKMTLEPLGKRAAVTQIEPRARLKIMHPNHTGMVLDQLTLLYVPLRIVTDMEVRQGDERVFAVQGSIAMAQNPVIEFDYRANGAETLHIEARDSAGAAWSRAFPIGQGS